MFYISFNINLQVIRKQLNIHKEVKTFFWITANVKFTVFKHLWTSYLSAVQVWLKPQTSSFTYDASYDFIHFFKYLLYCVYEAEWEDNI